MLNTLLFKSQLLFIRGNACQASLSGWRCLSHLSPSSQPILTRALDTRLNPALIQTSNSRELQIWVRDRGMGYKDKKHVTTKQHIIDGLKQLKNEVVMWKDEWKEKLQDDPILFTRPGETDVLWTFGDNEEEIKKFIVTSDSDHNEGHSKCTFKVSPAGYAVFSGHLDSKVPDDGLIKRAGYCNIKSIRVKKSFQRYTYYDWTQYNTLVLRVRGDGRPYMINLTTDGYYDIMWNDMHQYVLYTRGGPHWQTARIPFSKFFLAVRGRIQDKQCSLPLDRISSVGITAAGRVLMDGAFSLEIDYIGLEYDPVNEEEFAYEMYRVPKYIVGV